MEASSLIAQRRMESHAGYALAEGIATLAAAGWQALERQAAAFAERRRQAQARRELHGLSDHFLRDIGLERQQIDQLFR